MCPAPPPPLYTPAVADTPAVARRVGYGRLIAWLAFVLVLAGLSFVGNAIVGDGGPRSTDNQPATISTASSSKPEANRGRRFTSGKHIEAVARAAGRLPGSFVISCSGCPQNRGGQSLFLVSASGIGFRELLHGPFRGGYPRCCSSMFYPRWSPRGTTLAIDTGAEIWTIDIASHERQRLTQATTQPWDGTPAWSPDGRAIVFSRLGSLYTMTAQGKRVRKLVDPPSQVPASAPEWFSSPDWSPDGRRIAFGRSDPEEIYVIGADGTGLRRLAQDARLPRWSPDGRRLAFIAGVAQNQAVVIVARADGSHTRVVAHTSDVEPAVNLAWSPDGRRLAFVVMKTTGIPPDTVNSEQIVTLHLDGSDRRRVAIPQLPLSRYSEFYGIDWTPARPPSS
jgi:WD40 repeat protein